MNIHAIDILLVEDNPFEAKLAIKQMERCHMVGTFFHVPNGADALDFIYAREAFVDRAMADLPKVILLDLNLPKLSGGDVLTELKSNDLTRNIPVIILVSTFDDPNIEMTKQQGAEAFLIKPIEVENLRDVFLSLGLQWMMRHSFPIAS